MNDSQTLALLQAIDASKVLDPDQKRTLVNIFPRMTEEQKATLAEFLAKETAEFAKIESKYAAEKAPLYKEGLEKMAQAFAKADKLIAVEAEKSSTSKEQKVLETLINQL